MKTYRARQTLKAAVLVLVYLVIMALLFQTICYFVVWSKKDRVFEFKQNRINDFIRGDLSRNPGDDSLYYYDREGNILLVWEKDPFPAPYDNDEVKSLLNTDKLLNGQPQMKINYYYDNGLFLGTSYVIVGLPIIENEKITGYMIALDEFKDLNESLFSVFISFTIIYAINVIFWLFNNRRARYLTDLRNRYTDNITHELKTPIASIKALAEALADGMAAGEEDSYYNMIIQEANKEQNLIQNVLQLSKLQNNTERVNLHSVNGYEVFRESCESYSLLCELMGIELVITKEFEHLPKVRTDGNLIRVVFDNLMSNAVKYTPKGACDIENESSGRTVCKGRINISASVERKQVVICISDNGKGISEKDLPFIFERFYRANRNDEFAGNGLGLSMARAAILNLNEKIWVKSMEGKGSQFYFTIRRA